MKFTLMAAVALMLSACNYSLQKTSMSSELNTPFNLVSKSSFDTTVRPLVVQNCAGCHSNSQRPYHASNDLDVAYRDILSFDLVDLDNVTNSRLYRRLAVDNHNCWGGSCAASAQAMLDALRAWKTANDTTPLPDDPSRLTVAPITIPLNVVNAPVGGSLTAAATEVRTTILTHARGPVVLSWRVEKLDATTYRFFWPSLIAPLNVKVTLKDLRFKFNGRLLNDATFGFLFREVSGQGASTPVVMDSSLVFTVSIGNGPGVDQMGPSFGLLLTN